VECFRVEPKLHQKYRSIGCRHSDSGPLYGVGSTTKADWLLMQPVPIGHGNRKRRNLLLSELFGHERGAFTRDVERKRGKFELADGGTLFLDEIGDMSMDIQPKPLRMIEESSFEKVGRTKIISVDERIMAALQAWNWPGTMRELGEHDQYDRSSWRNELPGSRQTRRSKASTGVTAVPDGRTMPASGALQEGLEAVSGGMPPAALRECPRGGITRLGLSHFR